MFDSWGGGVGCRYSHLISWKSYLNLEAHCLFCQDPQRLLFYLFLLQPLKKKKEREDKGPFHFSS